MSTLRYVLRGFARSPGFTAVAVATLALGIGANAAVFSLVDAVLLRPLPYSDAERIVLLSARGHVRFRADIGFEVRPPQLRESRVFESVGVAECGGLNLGLERPLRVRACEVIPDFFRALGVEPILGRVFTDRDLVENPRLAVLEHGLWTRSFGADPAIVGQTIVLNDLPVLVTGVMPPRVEFPDRAEVWVSARELWQLRGSTHDPIVVARLAPGISVSQALDELIGIDDELGAGFPDRAVTPLRDAIVGPVRPVLSAVALGVVFVLLVACINVANLLFTRLSSREQELAVRRVLGASRLQLAGGALLESLILSVVAGAAALPVASWTLEGIRALLPAALHGAEGIALNTRAMAGLSSVTLATAVLVGLLPCLSIPERLSSYTRGTFGATVGPRHRRIRSGLVVAEVAVALLLLASAVTIMGTLSNLMRTDLGARGDNALVVELTPPHARYSRDDLWPFYERFVAALHEIPGVSAVGVTDQIPGDPNRVLVARPINVVGHTTAEPRGYALALCATPGYFDALGVDLLAGRTFTSGDIPGGPKVAVVSEGFVDALELSPFQTVGRYTDASAMMEPPESREIVGVVRDVRLHGPEQAFSPAVYFPCVEHPPFYAGHVVIRSSVEPSTLVPAVRRAAVRLDPNLPLYNVRTFDEIRATYLAERRLAMTATMAFGGLAFALAIVGLYGVMSYLVQLRTREIGIRLAFGASPSRVERDVLAAGLFHATAGIAIGTACTLGLSQLAWANVAGVEQVHPARVAALVVAVGCVAAVASWLPARRATKVDPVDALRAE